jgi:aldehyde:ferredoxin oxidoreductase
MYGWAGTILDVDLTEKKIVKRPLDLKFARAYLGGRGFNTRILYDEYDPAEQDPLAPSNVICISSGVLGGTLAPCSGRVTISVARSPLTGVFADGNAGGHFGPEIKFAGYDTIVLKGAADHPVYLSIFDDQVELRDARHIWGKDVWESDQILREEMGDPDAQVFVIGPAGENRVATAVTLCNLCRAPGGGGNGAVMGSKNLKAVVIRGTKGVKIADPETFLQACDAAHEQLLTHPIYPSWSKYGTPVLLGVYNEGRGLPVLNWQRNTYEGAEALDGPTFVRDHSLKAKACFSCPVHCSHYYEIKDGPYAGERAEGIEYEATDGFGARSGNDDMGLVLYLNKLHNLYGLCVVQGSNIICTAMHLWQDGILDSQITGGLNLEWGNREAMVELIEGVVFRKGFGAVFSDGFVKAAERIAEMKGLPFKDVYRYTIQSKGYTLSSYDPRPYKGGALEVGTATRGADHLRGLPTLEVFAHWYRGKRNEIVKDLGVPEPVVDDWLAYDLLDRHKYEGKARMVKYYQDQCTTSDALEICKFISSWRLGIGPEYMARLVSSATGEPFTWQDMMDAGDRIYTIEYAMQRRFGLGRADDVVPDRFFEEPTPDGDVIDREKYQQMLDEYYQLRGYDSEGRPSRAKLEALGMPEVADELAEKGALGEPLETPPEMWTWQGWV